MFPLLLPALPIFSHTQHPLSLPCFQWHLYLPCALPIPSCPLSPPPVPAGLCQAPSWSIPVHLRAGEASRIPAAPGTGVALGTATGIPPGVPEASVVVATRAVCTLPCPGGSGRESLPRILGSKWDLLPGWDRMSWAHPTTLPNPNTLLENSPTVSPSLGSLLGRRGCEMVWSIPKPQ